MCNMAEENVRVKLFKPAKQPPVPLKIRFTLVKNLYKMSLKSKTRLPLKQFVSS